MGSVVHSGLPMMSQNHCHWSSSFTAMATQRSDAAAGINAVRAHVEVPVAAALEVSPVDREIEYVRRHEGDLAFQLGLLDAHALACLPPSQEGSHDGDQ